MFKLYWKKSGEFIKEVDSKELKRLLIVFKNEIYFYPIFK